MATLLAFKKIFNLQVTKGAICSDPKRDLICFDLEGLPVTSSDQEEPQAISFDQDDRQILQRRLRGTCSVLAELHPIYFDHGKPQVICLDQKKPQAIYFDQKSQTDDKVEATYFDLEELQDIYSDRGDLKDICLGLDVRNKPVDFLLIAMVTMFIISF